MIYFTSRSLLDRVPLARRAQPGPPAPLELLAQAATVGRVRRERPEPLVQRGPPEQRVPLALVAMGERARLAQLALLGLQGKMARMDLLETLARREPPERQA